MPKHIHGGDIYQFRPKVDFSANINPLGIPEGVREAVEKSVGNLSGYPDPQCRALRVAVAEKEGIPENNLIFGNGAAELIFALAFALRPGHALLMAPGFAEYEQALRAVDCEISWYELLPGQGFRPDADYFERITDSTDMVFLCCPNNPTGICPSPEFLERTISVCREKGTVLVLDECFNGFLDEPERYSMKKHLFAYPNLFILKAFTKLYGMPGLRLGYGLSADRELLEKLSGVMQPWNVSVPAQEAGAAALKEDAYVEKARKLVKSERAVLTKGLRALGLTVYEGMANFLFFQGPPGLARAALEEGYLIRDCQNYRGLEEGYYRIAVRLPDENRELLEALKKILECSFHMHL